MRVVARTPLFTVTHSVHAPYVATRRDLRAFEGPATLLACSRGVYDAQSTASTPAAPKSQLQGKSAGTTYRRTEKKDPRPLVSSIQVHRVRFYTFLVPQSDVRRPPLTRGNSKRVHQPRYIGTLCPQFHRGLLLLTFTTPPTPTKFW